MGSSGSIIHIGSNPAGSLIKLALNMRNINWYVSTSTPGVLTNIYRDSEDSSLILFVNNRDEVTKGVEIALQSEALSLNDKREYELEDITGGTKCKILGEKINYLQLTVNGNDISILRLKAYGM